MMKAHHEPRKTAEQIEQEAAEWLVRSDDDRSVDQSLKLDAWLRQSPHHRAAFIRLSEAWRRSNVLTRLAPPGDPADPDLLDLERWSKSDNERAAQALTAPAFAGLSPATQSRRRRFSSALSQHRLATSAAAVVLMGLLGLAGWLMHTASITQTYATQVGEFRRVLLSDGSAIALNTNSQVKVRYTRKHRDVDLVTGQALFTVAHDEARPFDVSVGNLVVRAVGTEFSLRFYDPLSMDLVVSEGRVAINPPSKMTFDAGSVATVRNGRLSSEQLSSDDITRLHSWTDGRLVLHSASLATWVAEFNRYNSTHLVISSSELTRLRFSGNFRATEPNAFATALERTFGLKVRPEIATDGTALMRIEGGER